MAALDPPPTVVDVIAEALCNRQGGMCPCQMGAPADCVAIERYCKAALRVVSGLRKAGLLKDGA